MPPSEVTPLGRASISACELMARFPPRWKHRNKLAVYERSCPANALHRGEVTVSRWAERPLPLDLRWRDSATVIELRPDFYDYAPVASPRPAVEWQLNFAHTVLFVAYGGPLFAQDEMQVAEHPALGAVREWLLAESIPGLRGVTREDGRATPVLLRGVERRCAIATDADLDEGRPNGLYGNAFGRAPVDAVLRATRVIDPPTVSNVLAMEAPPGGVGAYTDAQVRGVVATAYTGFDAAARESRHDGRDTDVVIHTGHWGTGAYGGDRALMAILQLVSAKAAGVERLVFHAADARGMEPCERALRWLEVKSRSAPTLGAVIEAAVAERFEWGVSDGN